MAITEFEKRLPYPKEPAAATPHTCTAVRTRPALPKTRK
jgi:hypothetical protein